MHIEFTHNVLCLLAIQASNYSVIEQRKLKEFNVENVSHSSLQGDDELSSNGLTIFSVLKHLYLFECNL